MGSSLHPLARLHPCKLSTLRRGRSALLCHRTRWLGTFSAEGTSVQNDTLMSRCPCLDSACRRVIFFSTAACTAYMLAWNYHLSAPH
jgi:hypothetical protein